MPSSNPTADTPRSWSGHGAWLLLLITFSIPAAGRAETASGWVVYGGSPLNAMVIANGQHVFADPVDGRYHLDVPLNNGGQIVVQAFAFGFAPYRRSFDPALATDVTIRMDRSSSARVPPIVTYNLARGNREGRVTVSGTVSYGGVGVCALVLANRESMFTCGANAGRYHLDVPLNGHDSITLYVFAAGFQPQRRIIGPLTAAAGGISGIYEGSYSGSASGNWVIRIAESGRIAGVVTTSSGYYFGVGGMARTSDAVSFDVNGIAASTVTYSGTIDPVTGTFVCTWQDAAGTDHGGCLGNRVLPLTNGPPLDLLQHYPLSEGSYWLYDAKNQGASQWGWQTLTRMEDHESIHGVSAIQSVVYDSDYQNMQQPVDYDLLSFDDHYFYVHGSRQVGDPEWNDDPLGLTVNNPPFAFRRWLHERESGQTLSTLVTPGGDEFEVSIGMSLLGFEAVTTAAGTFNGCMKILMTFAHPDGVAASIDWWSPGVGKVKSVNLDTDGGADIEELRQYQIITGSRQKGSDPLSP